LTRNGSPNPPNLHKGDSRLLDALAGGESIKRAASLAGVSERTAHRRLASPDFARMLYEARARIAEASTGRLMLASLRAVATLEGLLASRSDSIRLGAARAILEAGVRWRESAEFAQRLRELEERVEEVEHGTSEGPFPPPGAFAPPAKGNGHGESRS